jgi:hypothetical protein
MYSPADGEIQLTYDDAATSGILGLGSLYAQDQIYISGIAVGDRLGLAGGGGNPVDSRAATGNINPDTDDSYNLGSTSLKWKELNVTSGIIPSGVVIAATDQPTSGFLVRVNSEGILTTSGPFAL